jgi:hypothetical protein
VALKGNPRTIDFYIGYLAADRLVQNVEAVFADAN